MMCHLAPPKEVKRFTPNGWITFVLCCTVLWIFPGSAEAQIVEDTSAVEIGFDDVEEAPPPTTSSGGWSDMVHLSGRFDLNFESENPNKKGRLNNNKFRNYHKFIFLKVTPTDRLTLDAEVLDLTYYEMRYDLTSAIALNVGKIWVPFGSTPFHHYYGGRQGDPFDGLLLPNVWSEFGAGLSGNLYTGQKLSIDGDAYVIRGFDGELGSVLQFTNGGSDDIFALGGRTRISIGSHLSAWGSVLYNQFGADMKGQLLLWGGDILLDYGFLNLPVLRDIRLRAAFARAEVQDELLVDLDDNSDHWYYRYGDYVEISYRGIGFVMPRVRYGTVIDFDDGVSNADSHNWEVALLARIEQHIQLLAQYQFNLEEINEIDNDLFRFGVIFEF